jgi:hypothetical protein
VSAPEQEDRLSSTRQEVLILRIVLDRQAQLRHGELLDAQSIRLGWFVSVQGMMEALSHWLAQQQPDDARNPEHATWGR